MSSQDVRSKHKQYLWPCTINYYKEPVVIAQGKGVVVKDLEGREYLDLFGGILTTSIAHGEPRVTRAIHEQVDRVVHTSTLYPSVPMVTLAERLASVCPGGLSQSFFTTSGTDADETAVMIAQTFTGRQEIVALRHCYSGRSLFAQSLTAHSTWRCVSTQLPFIKHAHSPYCYRCDLGLRYPACDLRCARDIETLVQTTTLGTIAGFIAEPIQGVGGFVTPPLDYFKVAVEIVRKHGGIFICDEVQTGFGRTGGKLWGIEHFGVTPDVMTMAKGIANGLPLGATVTRPEIAASLKGLSISTFGGNPISCAAAISVLEVIEKDKLVAHVAEAGRVLRDGLEAIKREFPKVVGEVRGMGLMQALELVVDEPAGDRTPNPQLTVGLFEATKKRGVLIGKGGLYGNVVRIAPPMAITRSQIEDGIKLLAESLAELC